MDFRKIIIKQMKKQKVSRMKLAADAGVHYQTINNYLTNKSSLSADHLEKIFDLLKIKII